MQHASQCKACLLDSISRHHMNMHARCSETASFVMGNVSQVDRQLGQRNTMRLRRRAPTQQDGGMRVRRLDVASRSRIWDVLKYAGIWRQMPGGPCIFWCWLLEIADITNSGC